MVDFDNKVPLDGEVFALSSRDGHLRAEFVETPGKAGAEERVAWRLYDRFGKGLLLTAEELQNICSLTKNYFKEKEND